ncbi:hypothetical protein [Galbibacter orientalis]
MKSPVKYQSGSETKKNQKRKTLPDIISKSKFLKINFKSMCNPAAPLVAL